MSPENFYQFKVNDNWFIYFELEEVQTIAINFGENNTGLYIGLKGGIEYDLTRAGYHGFDNRARLLLQSWLDFKGVPIESRV